MIGIIGAAAVWAATQPGMGVVAHHGLFPADDSVSRRGPYLTKLYDEKSPMLARGIDTEREWRRIRPDLRSPYQSGVSDN